MSTSAGDSKIDWSHTSTSVKVVVGIIVAFVAGVNLFVWYCFCCGFPRATTSSSSRNIISTISAAATTSSTRDAAGSSPERVTANVRATSTTVKREVCTANLPTFIYSAADYKEKIECAVCLMEMKDGEKGQLLPMCLHRFHAECINMWLVSHLTCPLCRCIVEAATADLDQLPV